MVLRTERAGDEAALDLLLTRAFDGSSVAGLVRLLRRHWPGYDPNLSVTAWDDERLVGQVLGLTALLRVGGSARLGLAVGPVAVDPDYQRQGIGRRMMELAHELGRAAGAEFAVLAGVPGYYPRLGYRPCWALAEVTIDRDALPAPDPKLFATPVQPADLPWLALQLEKELAAVELGWLWPQCLDCWSLPSLNATIWRTSDGRRAAYTLCRPNSPWDPPREALVLAEEPAAAVAAIARLRPASLAHHPDGWLARHALDPAWATVGEPSVIAPCMAFELQPGALSDYFTRIDAGGRPGTINWPLPFRIS